ncbi:hypothetical protein FHR83_007052 [Actinoplanes campanulatus]|uniref:Uncharacterized protein n=1 Tax=Actinoplanes campanulatus TaxID=113559 RepID=A0A7W5AN44_9ACTN|nr:hypothetical protein [Actinoplanes campanulatus]MBB3099346.1 hypothetical protein [Actinoplanes campanulatus]GGN40375.1 hypothetical protein GCM10010109_69400 [Actinoplanes campanulatus]GID40663.1 hypothetical protein Aca09nite_71690 [Actinoplanes campanulatus]
MPEPTDLPAARRADRDRELNNLVDWLLAQAADRDGLDVLEASVDLAEWMAGRLGSRELAEAVAALAIRLHRSASEVVL